MSVKPYVREVRKSTWYLAKWRDINHMLQEITCIFIGAYALLLVFGLRALAEGEGAYQLFLESLASPLSLGFHWLALAFTLFHSISWFSLTPKAMPVQIGENFVPGYLIAAGHYIAWIGVSLFIFFITWGFIDG